MCVQKQWFAQRKPVHYSAEPSAHALPTLHVVDTINAHAVSVYIKNSQLHRQAYNAGSSVSLQWSSFREIHTNIYCLLSTCILYM